jgi:AcrR family transcriptional regulator
LDAPAPSTGEKLIAAAAAEFDDHGFLGTDTNKIARRAGFAPQTFYRWHKDKTAIFLAVMAAREPEELNLIGWLLVGDAPEPARLEAAIEQRRQRRNYRRSLAWLSLEDPAVRAALAAARSRRIAQAKAWAPASVALEDGWIATALITLDRLIDAIAEGELADANLDQAAARTVIGRILAGIRSGEL